MNRKTANFRVLPDGNGSRFQFDSYKRRHPCCPHCSTILTADTKYCRHCGRLINTADVNNKE